MTRNIMSIRYKNTFADMLWFAAYIHTRTPALLSFYGVLGVFCLYVAYNSIPQETELGARIATTAIVFLVIVFLFATVAGVVMVLSLISTANKTFLTDHSITITEDGLVEETAFNRSESKWAGIPRLGRTRRHIFVYISQYAAHVIPRRAFPNAAAFDEFHTELQSRIQRFPADADKSVKP